MLTKNNKEFSWELAVKEATEIGTEFAKYLKRVFDSGLKLSEKNTEKIYCILEVLKNIFTKIKKSIIYTDYTATMEDINRINLLISQLEAYIHTDKSLFASDKTSLKSENIIMAIETRYYKIRNFVSQYIDISKNDIIFTEASWPDKSVLIGALRNSNQLNAALKYGFYHVPESITPNPESIRCIAIYQSKNLFPKDAGVKYYGKVIACRRVPRYEIKEIPSDSNREYYRFEIEKWKTLSLKIQADALGEVATETTLYQLLTAENTSELHLDSYLEYKIHHFMKSCAFLPFAANMDIENLSIYYDGNVFDIYENNRLKQKITSTEFSKNGVIRTRQIASILD